jgi:hypothetical protein
VNASTTVTMTTEQATALRKGHDAEAVRLSRMSRHELVTIYQSESGGGYTLHCSKDELISSVLALRGFGIERLNEAIHVLHHTDAVWPDCPFCAGDAS